MTNFNILLKELGKTGKAQIILFLMLSYINIYGGFSCFSTVYTTYLPNYRFVQTVKLKKNEAYSQVVGKTAFSLLLIRVTIHNFIDEKNTLIDI